MHVHSGSKIRNLLTVALKGYIDQGAVVWSGTGSAISKAITCAEILKRKNLPHQVTKICYRKVEEYWEPLLPDLDELVVVREEPTIHIFLSRQPLDSEEPGYQAPGTSLYINREGPQGTNKKSRTDNSRRSKPSRLSAEQLTGMGLRVGQKHNRNNTNKN